jgi:hypothetical protein
VGLTIIDSARKHGISDEGTPLTDEVVDKLVTDAYAALERGDYHVILNPHKTARPIKLSEQRRAELLAHITQKQ